VTDVAPGRNPTPAFHAMLRPHKETTTMKTTTMAVALGTTMLFAGAARAGVTMVVQRGPAATASTSTIYLDGDRIRVEGAQKTQRDTSVIVDGAAKKMIMINATEKSYMEMTEADIKKMKAQVDAMRAQAMERMKNLPPEQRKQMEKMMGGMGAMPGADAKPAKLDFQAMGQKKTVNGFACDMYKVSRDGVPKEEDCISPWSAKVLQKSDFEGFRKFAEEMAKQMGSTGAQNDMMEQFEKFPGLPITRHPLDGGDDEEIKSVKRGSIPAAQFAVPAGYTKKEVPQMGAPGMGHHGGPGMGGPGMGGPGHHPGGPKP
jgi:hypothetical protein